MLNFIEVSVCDLHVRKQLAMISIVRRLRIPAMLQYLLDTHTVVVVFEGQRLSVAGHLLELATCRPGKCPCAIIGRIANRIVGNGLAVVGGELVLPIASP